MTEQLTHTYTHTQKACGAQEDHEDPRGRKGSKTKQGHSQIKWEPTCLFHSHPLAPSFLLEQAGMSWESKTLDYMPSSIIRVTSS